MTHRAACATSSLGAWPLERILFAMAGTVTLVAVVLAATVSPWWLVLAAFVGVNQLAFVAFGDCVASLRPAQAVRRRARVRPMSASTCSSGPVGRLGRYAATHVRLVALAWVVVAVGLGFLAPRVETALSGAGWEATGSRVRRRAVADPAAVRRQRLERR